MAVLEDSLVDVFSLVLVRNMYHRQSMSCAAAERRSKRLWGRWGTRGRPGVARHVVTLEVLYWSIEGMPVDRMYNVRQRPELAGSGREIMEVPVCTSPLRAR